ncbi:hypothetical protein [Phenylobacterium deserti]|uniref:Uncharacterized protein n=1 Tax=Phenylobacterium deserti TaxID=1914756 RepID=A0A328ADC0_9CAUL|nr:hypothetical protein [Phenylobacterium deserti]RAK52216.1 hypothetical protein DJ018_13785 [Phenylobacterium deserti]
MTEQNQPLRGASREEKAALYRANAARLLKQAANSQLPQERAKLEAAAAQWLSLAEGEDPDSGALTQR